MAFLGTPHRGSDLAGFVSGIGNITKVALKRVNTNLLRLLKRNSEVLAGVEEDFSIWLRKKHDSFNLTCFFEEQELPGIGMVVQKESAKIGGYPQQSIPANHMVRIFP